MMSTFNTRKVLLRGATSPPRIFTLVLMAGLSVTAMNIYLPMLPDLTEDLQTTNALGQLTLTLFLAMTAIAQVIVGPLSDRFGRRPVLLTTAMIFLFSTLICIFATSIEMLLIGRVLQASSAAQMALSRAIVRDLYDREKAASMIGYVTMAMAVMPMVAPVIGGSVGEFFGWRGPFVIVLLLGIAVTALIWFDLGETHAPVKNPVSEQISDYFSLLREPLVWGYLMAAATSSGAYFAFIGGAPFVGEHIIGMSATSLGLHLGTVALGYMFGNFLSGRYSQRIGIEPMMACGGIISCLGVGLALFLMTSFEPRAAFLFFPMILVGTGNGMTLPNANAGAISVRPELAGSASGLAGFLTIGGGAALATLSGILITVENAAVPLYVIMFLSSLAGAVISVSMFLWARRHPGANTI